MSRRELLEAQAESILRQLSELPDYPPEPNSDEVLFIRVQFSNGRRGVYYNYAGVRNDTTGVWYLTGARTIQRWPNGVSWEGLIDWLSAHDYELWTATDYVRVAGNL